MLAVVFTLVLSMAGPIGLRQEPITQPLPCSPEVSKLLDSATKEPDPGKRQVALDRALEQAKALKDRQGEGLCLSALAKHFASAKKPDQALDYAGRALTAYRETGDLMSQARTLGAMGNSFWSVGKLDQSIASLDEAIPLFDRCHDYRSEGIALLVAGNYLWVSQRPREALERYLRATPIFEKTDYFKGQGDARYSAARVYQENHVYEKAISLYEAALPLYVKCQDEYQQAATLNNSGAIYAEIGQPDEAMDRYSKALPLFVKFNDALGQGNIYLNRGSIHRNQGELPKALEEYDQALKLYRSIADTQNEASVLTNVAMVYRDLCDTGTALAKFKAAHDLFQQAKIADGVANTLSGMGDIDFEQGDYDDALAKFEEALKATQGIENPRLKGGLISNVAAALLRQGKKAEARAKYEEALPLFRTDGDVLGEAAALTGLATCLSEMDNPSAAQAAVDEAIPLFRRGGDAMGEARAWMVAADVQKRAGATPLAIAKYKLSANLRQELRRKAKALSPNMQRSYAHGMGRTYRNLYDALVEQGRFTEAQRSLAMLEGERLDQGSRKGVIVRDPLELQIRYTQPETTYLDERESALLPLVKAGSRFDELRIKGLRTDAEEAEFRALGSTLEAARTSYFATLKEVTEAFNGTKPNERDRDALNYQDVFGQVTSQLTSQTKIKTAVLTTLVTDSSVLSVLYVGSSPPLKHTFAIDPKSLNTRVKALLDGYASPEGDPRTASAEFLEQALGPLVKAAKAAGVKVLMLALDGTLRTLPWQAMWDGGAQTWLGDEFSLPECTIASYFNLLAPSTPVWNVAAFGNSKGLDGSPDIPGALAETLAAVKSAGKGRAWNGPTQFKADAFRKVLSDGAYNVLHVASHFNLEPGSDRDSYLLLADGTKFSVSDMRSISSIGNGSCELMVLSACQTAVPTGDGSMIEGLAASTETKGPKAVIASLWRVDDVATTKLMAAFYSLRATHHEWTKLQCLDEATRRLRQGALGAPGQGEWRSGATATPPSGRKWAGPGLHPYYWAPFVLFGNWR